MKRLLALDGYPCETASNGQEALAFIRRHPPEQPLLVVLDLMMPGMTGMDVLKEIRSDPKIEHTSVLMYSAGFSVEYRDEAITLRALGWVYKGTEQGFEEIRHCYERIGGVAGKKYRPDAHARINGEGECGEAAIR
jgi:CheY-like chemotaxis protein